MNEVLRILVVEDDRRLAALVRDYLHQQGYEVSVEHRGDSAPERIINESPDLVILDIMLPGMDGFDVCRSVRSEYKGPILILTAREDDMDQVAGLEIGADDYVKKPVVPRVLLARIRALLRRYEKPGSRTAVPPPQSDGELVFGSLRLVLPSYSAYRDGQPVDLTTNEFELLWLLASRAGEVLDRDTILMAMRGIDYDGLDRSVDIAVSRIRKKTGDDAGRGIKTIRARGYLFVSDAWQE